MIPSMLQAIGYMVGFYILTKMVELCTRPVRPWLVITLAVITCLVAIGGMLALLMLPSLASSTPTPTP